MFQTQGTGAAPAAGGSAGSKKKDASAKKEDHQFWKSQPIPDVGEDVSANEPYEADKKQEDIRQTPYSLPDGYEWAEVDVENEAEVCFLFLSIIYYCCWIAHPLGPPHPHGAVPLFS